MHVYITIHLVLSETGKVKGIPMDHHSPKEIISRAAAFVALNTRLLERQRFHHLFAGGPPEPVLAALHAYQNGDGGFGNALEPDKRCRESQPVDAQVALEVVDEIGFDLPTAQRVCDYLTMITTDAGGVPFVLPSVASAPRQPWWNSDPDPPESLNPTAAIAGLLHKHAVQHPWLVIATEYCWKAIAASETEEPHELLCILTFLEHAPDQERATREFDRIATRLQARSLVARDPQTPGYVKMPLEWAPTPQHRCRQLFSDDLIAAHLDALTARQQPDGGWPITWGALSPGSELEWRGMVTITALKTLQAYGRL